MCKIHIYVYMYKYVHDMSMIYACTHFICRISFLYFKCETNFVYHNCKHIYMYIYIYIHRFVSFCIHCWCKREIKFRPAIFALIYHCTKSITTLRTNKNRAKSHICTLCDSKFVQNQNRIESQICTLQEHQRLKVSITPCDLFSIYMILAKLHQN